MLRLPLRAPVFSVPAKSVRANLRVRAGHPLRQQLDPGVGGVRNAVGAEALRRWHGLAVGKRFGAVEAVRARLVGEDVLVFRVDNDWADIEGVEGASSCRQRRADPDVDRAGTTRRDSALKPATPRQRTSARPAAVRRQRRPACRAAARQSQENSGKIELVLRDGGSSAGASIAIWT